MKPIEAPLERTQPTPPNRRRRQFRGNAWLAEILALLVVGISACAPPESKHALRRRELVLEQLGSAIAGAAPGAKVLVFGNPFTQAPGAESSIREAEEASIRGLKRGLGQGAALVGVGHPDLKGGALEDPRSFPIPAGATTPISFLTSPGAWDRLVASNPSATVLVSLIGIPEDLAQTRAWTDPAGPRWALYLPDLRLIGSTSDIRAAFESQRLLAIVLNRQNAPPESESVGPDPQAEFNRRYLLITKENVEELSRAPSPDATGG